MTVTPARIVIDLDLVGEEAQNKAMIETVLSDVSLILYDPDNVLDTWAARIEDPREEQTIVVCGSPIDGFRFFGPVPNDAGDAGDIDESGEFKGEEWWRAALDHYPNRGWEPLRVPPTGLPPLGH